MAETQDQIKQNMFHIAIWSLMAIVILVPLDMYEVLEENNGVITDQNIIYEALSTSMLGASESINEIEVNNGICPPNSQNCEENELRGEYEASNFDIASAILNIPKWMYIGGKIITYTVIGPELVAYRIGSKVENVLLQFLLSIMYILWRLTIIYHVYGFITNKRGQ